MSRKMRVWGGMTLLSPRNNTYVRTIVATTTKTEAMRILDVTPWVFNGWWSATGNKTELKIALAKPGIVFICTDDRYGGNYIERKLDGN